MPQAMQSSSPSIHKHGIVLSGCIVNLAATIQYDRFVNCCQGVFTYGKKD